MSVSVVDAPVGCHRAHAVFDVACCFDVAVHSQFWRVEYDFIGGVDRDSFGVVDGHVVIFRLDDDTVVLRQPDLGP